MHVRQLHVSRYGPIGPFTSKLGPFVLVHGANEMGKTLLIDALIRLLLKNDLKSSKMKLFGNLGRVDEKPEGYVVLEDSAGEHKLEADQSIMARGGFDLSVIDFRNLFVIRDSDLTVRDESDYYGEITEKLTGLNSSRIVKIQQAVQKMGRLRSASSGSALVNNAEQGKIADQVKGARSFVEDARRISAGLRKDGHDGLLEELVEARRIRGISEDRLREQKAAELRNRYLQAAALIAEVRSLEKTLAAMPPCDHATGNRWEGHNVESNYLERELDQDRAQRDELQAEYDRSLELARAVENEVRAQEMQTVRVTSGLLPRVEAYHYERAEFKRTESRGAMVKIGLGAAISLFVLVAVAFSFSPSSTLAAMGGAAVVGAVVAVLSLRRTSQLRHDLQRRAAELCADARGCSISVESVNGLRDAIADFERLNAEAREQARIKVEQCHRVESQLRALDQKIKDSEQRLVLVQASLRALEAETGMSDLEAYRAQVDRRAATEHALAAKRSLMKSQVPFAVGGNSSLDDLDATITRFLEDTAGATDVVFDGAEAEILEARIRDRAAEEAEINRRLDAGKRALHTCEVRARALRAVDIDFSPRTTADLDHMAEILDRWCDGVEDNQKTAQEAIRILDEIESEDRARVGDLFGVGSPVTRLFAEITDGLYNNVEYDAAGNRVMVARSDGSRVSADALSGGAFDQLYLSIRLAIADRLSGEEKGFFIMDDPFLKADMQRLASSLDVLRRFVARGWQVLYFSAKEEVRRALQVDIDTGRVQLITLNSQIDAAAAARKPARPADDLFSILPSMSTEKRPDSAMTSRRESKEI